MIEGKNKDNIKKNIKSKKDILANKEEIIRKRKRKKALRRVFLILTILVIILTTLALKTQYFNITSIEVTGLINLKEDDIKGLLPFKNGDNILKINVNKSKESIKSNPYVENVEIRRKFPNKINVNVEEKYAKYYVQHEDTYILLDSDGTVIESKKDIEGLNLYELRGMDPGSLNVGEKVVFEDERNIDFMKEFYNLMSRNQSSIKFNSIDMNSVINLKVYSNNIEIRIGTIEKLQDKLNVAINLIEAEGLSDKVGYIDVSFNGSPVINIE